jgi:hypothetical protein
VISNAKRFGATHRSDWDMINNRLTRVEHRETSGGAGWFIVEYESPQAMTRDVACEVVGPYETQAQAVRILNSAALPPGRAGRPRQPARRGHPPNRRRLTPGRLNLLPRGSRLSGSIVVDFGLNL